MTAKKTTTKADITTEAPEPDITRAAYKTALAKSREIIDALMTATGLDPIRISRDIGATPGTITLNEFAGDDPNDIRPRTYQLTEITTPGLRHGGRAEVTPEGTRADMPTPTGSRSE